MKLEFQPYKKRYNIIKFDRTVPMYIRKERKRCLDQIDEYIINILLVCKQYFRTK